MILFGAILLLFFGVIGLLASGCSQPPAPNPVPSVPASASPSATSTSTASATSTPSSTATPTPSGYSISGTITGSVEIGKAIDVMLYSTREISKATITDYLVKNTITPTSMGSASYSLSVNSPGRYWVFATRGTLDSLTHWGAYGGFSFGNEYLLMLGDVDISTSNRHATGKNIVLTVGGQSGSSPSPTSIPSSTSTSTSTGTPSPTSTPTSTPTPSYQVRGLISGFDQAASWLYVIASSSSTMDVFNIWSNSIGSTSINTTTTEPYVPYVISLAYPSNVYVFAIQNNMGNINKVGAYTTFSTPTANRISASTAVPITTSNPVATGINIEMASYSPSPTPTMTPSLNISGRISNLNTGGETVYVYALTTSEMNVMSTSPPSQYLWGQSMSWINGGDGTWTYSIYNNSGMTGEVFIFAIQPWGNPTRVGAYGTLSSLANNVVSSDTSVLMTFEAPTRTGIDFAMVSFSAAPTPTPTPTPTPISYSISGRVSIAGYENSSIEVKISTFESMSIASLTSGFAHWTNSFNTSESYIDFSASGFNPYTNYYIFAYQRNDFGAIQFVGGYASVTYNSEGTWIYPTTVIYLTPEGPASTGNNFGIGPRQAALYGISGNLSGTIAVSDNIKLLAFTTSEVGEGIDSSPSNDVNVVIAGDPQAYSLGIFEYGAYYLFAFNQDFSAIGAYGDYNILGPMHLQALGCVEVTAINQNPSGKNIVLRSPGP